MPRKPATFKRYREGVIVTARKRDTWARPECAGHCWELTSRVYLELGEHVQDARCLVCQDEVKGWTIDWFQELATLNYVLACDVLVGNRIRALEASQKILRKRQSKLSPREALEGF